MNLIVSRDGDALNEGRNDAPLLRHGRVLIDLRVAAAGNALLQLPGAA